MAALTPEQLASLEERLDHRHASLLEETQRKLASENLRYAEIVGGVPADHGDQFVGAELADLNQEMANRHLRELREIEAAKMRIEYGHYGICVQCGSDIGFERLLAYPTALRCRACQEQWEKTRAHSGSPRL